MENGACLYRRYIAGDDGAFDSLMDLYHDGLILFINKLVGNYAVAEELAADAFGAAHAFLMVGGTTSSVQRMVLTACKRGDEIILPRNVHRSVLNALVLCGAVPVYVNPEVDHRLGISLGMKRSANTRTPWRCASKTPHTTAFAATCAQSYKWRTMPVCCASRTKHTARTFISAAACRSPLWRRVRIWRPFPCTKAAAA